MSCPNWELSRRAARLWMRIILPWYGFWWHLKGTSTQWVCFVVLGHREFEEKNFQSSWKTEFRKRKKKSLISGSCHWKLFTSRMNKSAAQHAARVPKNLCLTSGRGSSLRFCVKSTFILFGMWYKMIITWASILMNVRLIRGNNIADAQNTEINFY